jgi:hypothetical protein
MHTLVKMIVVFVRTVYFSQLFVLLVIVILAFKFLLINIWNFDFSFFKENMHG